mmetsp:Transcript_40615/g.161067  ORF Transcript_40615/g.161067 Transcript_40615/m.161067 type:complete len:110 (+) Transcript_40615:131-460(+)
MPAIFGNWTFKYRIKLQRWRRGERHWFRLVLLSRFRRLRGKPVLKLGFFYPNFLSYDETMERSARCFIDVKAVKKLLGFGVQPTKNGKLDSSLWKLVWLLGNAFISPNV